MTSAQLSAEYSAKWNDLQELEDKLEAKEAELKGLEKQRQLLDEKVAETRGKLQQAKADTEQGIAALLHQHNLSKDKVHTVMAVIDGALNEAGLPEDSPAALKEKIKEAVSLHLLVEQLTEQHKNTQTSLQQQAVDTAKLGGEIKRQEQHYQGLLKASTKLEHQNEVAEACIIAREDEIKPLEERRFKLIHDFISVDSIMNFLETPQSMTLQQFDRLVRLLIAIRHTRSGKKLDTVSDHEGTTHYVCEVPVLLTKASATTNDFEMARGLLADGILPLVKDQYIHKIDHQIQMGEQACDLMKRYNPASYTE